MYSIEDLLQLLLSECGEAVHFHPSEAPVIEVSGVLHRIEGPALADGESDLLLEGIASEEDLQEFRQCRILSFDYLFKQAVFRVIAFGENGQTRLEIRKIV